MNEQIERQADRQADIQAVSCSDDPVAIDDATAAEMHQVVPLKTALPRPRVRPRVLSANDTT